MTKTTMNAAANKDCGSCGRTLAINQFYWRSDRGSYTSKCKDCFYIYQKLYKSNPEVVARQRPLRAAWQKKAAEKSRDELGDAYIKKLLVQKTAISQSILPAELVDAKRVQLKIKRLLEENK